MKFATIALVATASALQVRKGCVSKEDSHAIFSQLDTNNNGKIG